MGRRYWTAWNPSCKIPQWWESRVERTTNIKDFIDYTCRGLDSLPRPGGDKMLQAELGDTLCPIFMFRDLRARPPSHSQGEAPAPTPDLGSSERHQERWGGVDELPGAWPRFHCRTGTGDGEVGNGAEQSIVSKANQQSSKDGNQQD